MADGAFPPLLCCDLPPGALADLLARHGAELAEVPAREAIPGSYWGDSEAGIIGTRVYVRGDTPVHSALHEACHLFCLDAERRATLHTDAGGDYDEENAVCYLQILLGAELPGFGRERAFADMDAWGYSFRLGSARAWFEEDAEDARAWLVREGLLSDAGEPTFRMRA
ncbi:MAG TPA: hypothetical protein VF017_06915 [Thermoanaerobaculia bacterium]|nr:hypothetical protein [Thermoanaerobaculia bacterium]